MRVDASKPMIRPSTVASPQRELAEAVEAARRLENKAPTRKTLGAGAGVRVLIMFLKVQLRGFWRAGAGSGILIFLSFQLCGFWRARAGSEVFFLFMVQFLKFTNTQAQTD